MKVAAWILAVGVFALAVQLPIRITTPIWQAHVPKGAAQALSTYLVVFGAAGGALAVVAFARQASVAMAVAAAMALSATLLASAYLGQVRAPSSALTEAFGPGWEQHIPVERTEAMLAGRWRWALPSGPEPRWARDIGYWKLSGTDRELFADVWQPPAGTPPSGLALVYVHGGYYEMLDKDTGTRPLFRHLARQGHVVMDISYRLVDETDLFGMVGDVKRAVAWLKDHAGIYRVDADRIVLAGASAGGNLALLAGYTLGHPDLTPDDVLADTSVRGVVAYYGVHDWPAFARLPGDDVLAHRLLGDTVEEVPRRRYALASPVTHGGRDAPATLLLQGLHDQEHLITAGRDLQAALQAAGARVGNVELAWTDHAFDLILGRISPPGIAALHDLERFLAVLAAEPERQGR